MSMYTVLSEKAPLTDPVQSKMEATSSPKNIENGYVPPRNDSCHVLILFYSGLVMFCIMSLFLLFSQFRLDQRVVQLERLANMSHEFPASENHPPLRGWVTSRFRRAAAANSSVAIIKPRSTGRAIHLVPQQSSAAVIQQVREHDQTVVDCGMRTRVGLKIHCKVTNFWVPDPSLPDSTAIYQYVNGVIVMRKSGLFFLYGHITHHDVLGSWSYAVYKLSETARIGNGQPELLVKCAGMEPHNVKNSNDDIYPILFQCHVGRVVVLNKGDHIFLQDLYFQEHNRVMKLDPAVTFWGMVKFT